MDVSILPIFSIAPIACAPLPSDYAPAILLAISIPALAYGLAALPAAFKALPCYAIGRSSAEVWRAAGYTRVSSPAEETSEGLLALADLENLEAKPILLLRGEGGRPTLADGLRARGAHLVERVVYRRLAPSDERCNEIQCWVTDGSDSRRSAVLISSAEALERLCAIIAPAQRQHLQALCLGERIGALAQANFGRTSILTNLQAATIAAALNDMPAG